MNQLYDFFNNEGISFTIVKMMVPAFMSVLFLQSGLDKVFNYKGNLAYITDYFKKSPLAKTVNFLMPTITFLEMTAGILSALGTFSLISGNKKWAFWGLTFAAISLLALFFGQRVAKDYGGAVSLATYFILTVFGLLILV